MHISSLFLFSFSSVVKSSAYISCSFLVCFLCYTYFFGLFIWFTDFLFFFFPFFCCCCCCFPYQLSALRLPQIFPPKASANMFQVLLNMNGITCCLVKLKTSSKRENESVNLGVPRMKGCKEAVWRCVAEIEV